MTTVQVKSAGVSLQYPNTWTVVPVTKKGVAAMAKKLAKNNPGTAAVLSNIQDVSRYKLHAIDVGGEPVHSNVVVLLDVGAPHGISLADVRNQFAEGFKLAGDTFVDAKNVNVAGKTAFRIDATSPFKNADGTIIYQSQGALVIPGAHSSTAITVTASDDAAGMALINAILASVRPA